MRIKEKCHRIWWKLSLFVVSVVIPLVCCDVNKLVLYYFIEGKLYKYLNWVSSAGVAVYCKQVSWTLLGWCLMVFQTVFVCLVICLLCSCNVILVAIMMIYSRYKAYLAVTELFTFDPIQCSSIAKLVLTLYTGMIEQFSLFFFFFLNMGDADITTKCHRLRTL